MIRSLELINFRSFPQLELAFDQNLIILHGPNGIGKTNILESVYMLAVGKSFRAPDPQIIRHQQEFFVAKKYLDDKTSTELRYQNTDDKKHKQLLRNGKKQALSRHLGQTPVVLFAPADIEIITAPSAARRELLDVILTQTNQSYTRYLALYKKILQGRNALLRRYKQGLLQHSALEDQLFVCDLQIIRPAEYINKTRQKLVADITPALNHKYQQIAHQPDQIEITYQPSPSSNLAEELHQNIGRDLGAGHTTTGPHRDDISFQLNTHPLTTTASRGEMRTVMLALKLAELDYIQTQLKTTPTLLLDDVFSELDHRRQGFLLESVGDAQTIITTTGVENLRQPKSKSQLIDVGKLA